MPGHVGVSNLQVNLWGAIAHKAHGDGESKNPGPCFFFGGGGGGTQVPQIYLQVTHIYIHYILAFHTHKTDCIHVYDIYEPRTLLTLCTKS